MTCAIHLNQRINRMKDNIIAVSVLLGLLDAGNNEFGEDSLVLQVFVEIFFYI